MRKKTFGSLLALGIVLLLTGCPFGHGHAKKGEKCIYNHDCDQLRCSTECDVGCAGKAKEGVCTH